MHQERDRSHAASDVDIFNASAIRGVENVKLAHCIALMEYRGFFWRLGCDITDHVEKILRGNCVLSCMPLI